MNKETESSEAGKNQDMGIKTSKGQDSEGHFPGSKKAEFNERQTQERQSQEDDNELNQTDARGNVSGTENV